MEQKAKALHEDITKHVSIYISLKSNNVFGAASHIYCVNT